MFVKITPTRNNVLIIQAELTNVGDLIVPEQHRAPEHPTEGIVLEVGPDVECCKKGDRVAVAIPAGRGLVIDLERKDKTKGLLVPDSFIAAVVENRTSRASPLFVVEA